MQCSCTGIQEYHFVSARPPPCTTLSCKLLLPFQCCTGSSLTTSLHLHCQQKTSKRCLYEHRDLGDRHHLKKIKISTKSSQSMSSLSLLYVDERVRDSVHPVVLLITECGGLRRSSDGLGGPHPRGNLPGS